MAKSGRRLARHCAVQALYQWRITGQAPSEIRDSFINNDNLTGAHHDYFLRLIRRIPDCIDNIDERLAAHLDRDPDRVDFTAQAILRLGVYELIYEKEIPQKVALDEAVELAKTFCDENGYKYINGVLDKVAKENERVVE